MSIPALKHPFSPDDYLAWEAEQEERHEYVAGEVFCISGSSAQHNMVCLNAAMALRKHGKINAFHTYALQMKVRVEAADSYFYPDVVETCSPRDAQDPLIQREPTLIVEVLSPSTAAYDRGGKFSAYRQLASLQEYVLIDTDTRATDVYRKGADGLWVLHPFERHASVELASVALTLPAAVLFDEVPEHSVDANALSPAPR